MFTLTQGDGSRLQGFCRRFLPPAPRVGSKLRYPQVLCLVCEAAWAAFFFKVCMQSGYKQQDQLRCRLRANSESRAAECQHSMHGTCQVWCSTDICCHCQHMLYQLVGC